MNWLIGAQALWFSVPAIAGTTYFLLHLLLGQLGGDVDMDTDFDIDAPDGDAGGEFRVLSLQTLSAFAMASGWMGLATLNFTGAGMAGAAVVAVLSGIGVAWFLMFLLRSLFKLQSSGTLDLSSAIGKTGRVYILIPPMGEGRGKVQLVVQGRQAVLNAVQSGSEPIASRTPVRVVEADKARNVLIVEIEM